MNDYYQQAFIKFMGDGMTSLEALQEFEREEFNKALLSDVELRGFDGSASDGLLKYAGMACREEMNEKDMLKAIELWIAGWVSETPNKTQIDVMSWYWRRPPRRIGKLGRKFLSTDQAYNAMKKDLGD